MKAESFLVPELSLKVVSGIRLEFPSGIDPDAVVNPHRVFTGIRFSRILFGARILQRVPPLSFLPENVS